MLYSNYVLRTRALTANSPNFISWIIFFFLFQSLFRVRIYGHLFTRIQESKKHIHAKHRLFLFFFFFWNFHECMSALLASRITLDVCSCFTIDIYTLFLLLFANASECDSHTVRILLNGISVFSLFRIMTERSD